MIIFTCICIWVCLKKGHPKNRLFVLFPFKNGHAGVHPLVRHAYVYIYTYACNIRMYSAGMYWFVLVCADRISVCMMYVCMYVRPTVCICGISPENSHACVHIYIYIFIIYYYNSCSHGHAMDIGGNTKCINMVGNYVYRTYCVYIDVIMFAIVQ